MNKSAIAAACLTILLVGAAGVFLLWKFRPIAEKEVAETPMPSVEVLPVERRDVEVVLPSQGVVEAVVETALAAEVSGRVEWVAEAFREGGRFEAGDELLRIEAVDYRARLAEARAAEADARLALELEEARKTQAVRDWEKLGRGEDPGGLVLRDPQVASARARLEAAVAAVAAAEHDLSRTSIRAPYAGRVRSTSTDIGSYLTVAAPVAEIYSTEALEVRLPITVDDFTFLGAPADDGAGRPVRLTADLANGLQSWEARLARVEGEVDRATRSVFLIARLEQGHSFAIGDGNVLAPGLFVRAEIPGKTLNDVVRVPRTAAYGPDEVLVVDDEDRIRFRRIEVVRGERRHLVVGSGLEEGERICVTPLAKATEGMPVRVLETREPGPEPGSREGEGEGEKSRPEPVPAQAAPVLDARR